MADAAQWQRFTKASSAESAPKREGAAAAALAKSSKAACGADAGQQRLPEPITEGERRAVAPEQRPKEPTYAEGRCRSFDPNYNRAPFSRTHAPRLARKRRPEGWTATWFVLPKVTLEGLQKVAVTLAEEGNIRRGPANDVAIRGREVIWWVRRLIDFFKKLGFPEFCLEPPNESDRTRRSG